jgi:uncharacterized protein YjeT (DUF2065 family)
MSTLGPIFIIAGLLVILLRGPMIFLPDAYRALALRLVGSRSAMRGFGIFAAILGALLMWAVRGDPTGLAQFLYGLGIVIATLSIFFMIPFPTRAGKIAEAVWSSFNNNVLRGLGVFAVAIGGWLVIYGLSL